MPSSASSGTVEDGERGLASFGERLGDERAPEFVGALIHRKRVEGLRPVAAFEVKASIPAVAHATQIGE